VSGALGLTAIVSGADAGIALGVAGCVWRQTSVDVESRVSLWLGIALARVCSRPLLALIFGVVSAMVARCRWEGGAPRYFVLPALTLALPVIAYVTRTHTLEPS